MFFFPRFQCLEMGDVAKFCNSFPNVEMAFEVQDSDEITAGDPVTLLVTLEREGEDDEEEPEGGWGKVLQELLVGWFFGFLVFWLV